MFLYYSFNICRLLWSVSFIISNVCFLFIFPWSELLKVSKFIFAKNTFWLSFSTVYFYFTDTFSYLSISFFQRTLSLIAPSFSSISWKFISLIWSLFSFQTNTLTPINLLLIIIFVIFCKCRGKILSFSSNYSFNILNSLFSGQGKSLRIHLAPLTFMNFLFTDIFFLGSHIFWKLLIPISDLLASKNVTFLLVCIRHI